MEKQKTPNIEHTLKVTFEDMYNNITKKVNITRYRYNEDGKLEKDKKTFLIPLYYDRVSFNGEADEEKDKNPGDVIINIVLREKEGYQKVNEYDIMREEFITIYDIYNGIKKTFDYFGEKITIKTKPLDDTKMVTDFRFNRKIINYGFPKPDYVDKKLRGDLYIIFRLKLPEIDKMERKILFEMFGTESQDIVESNNKINTFIL